MFEFQSLGAIATTEASQIHTPPNLQPLFPLSKRSNYAPTVQRNRGNE
ncbi:MAG: hypothetical protein AAF685_15210 [Cyanobacteria bacterium P01_C01_bin.89]